MSRAATITAIAIFVGLGTAAGALAHWKSRALAAQNQGMGGYEPAETVSTAPARTVLWGPTADLVGTALSVRSVRLMNERSGVVKTVEFTPGGVVEEGQVLLTLDDATDRADLAAAEAGVKVAEATAAVALSRKLLADAELKRMEASGARGVSEMDLDRGRSEARRAHADHERTVAEAELAVARRTQVQVRLSKTVIRAPFRARASISEIHEGQYLAEGTQIVELEELCDRIHLDFAIPQEYLARVTTGTSVLASGEILGPDPVRITVSAIDAQVDYNTRNVRIRAVVDNRNGLLRAGMFIQIRVPTEEPKTYTVVPATAVRRTSFADMVFIVAPGESPGKLRAKTRFVKVGPTVGDDVVILEGVKPGEEIATTGSFKLRDGGLVMKAPPAEPGSAAAGTAAPGKS